MQPAGTRLPIGLLKKTGLSQKVGYRAVSNVSEAAFLVARSRVRAPVSSLGAVPAESSARLGRHGVLPMNLRQAATVTRVTAAILIKDGRIIIARRRSADHQGDKWEFPGGKIEPGETPEQCLQREIKEELDIEVSVGRFLGSSIYHYDHISIELLAYRTYWQKGSITLKAHAAYRWVPLEHLDQYDFAPADRPLAARLQSGALRV